MKKTKKISLLLLFGLLAGSGVFAQTPKVATIQSKNATTEQPKVVQQPKKQRQAPMSAPAKIVMDTLVVRDTVLVRDTLTVYQIDSAEALKFKKLENRTDLFQGLTRKLPYERMIPPYGLEVTFDKTVHIIFPTNISYVDLGSDRIIAAKAGDAENVLRVKSSEEYFFEETNMSVITESGSFYTFNVKFAKEPELLNIEMQNFMSDGDVVNRPNNSMEVYLKELNGESPMFVRMLMKSIYDKNQRIIKHIGSKRSGVQFVLKGIYAFNYMLYFHTEIINNTNVPYNLDYLTFKIVDKKLIQRTTIQEIVLKPVRAYNYLQTIDGRKTETAVFAIPIFTIPQEKNLIFEMHEKNGGRHQSFIIENSDLVRAKQINELMFN